MGKLEKKNERTTTNKDTEKIQRLGILPSSFNPNRFHAATKKYPLGSTSQPLSLLLLRFHVWRVIGRNRRKRVEWWDVWFLCVCVWRWFPKNHQQGIDRRAKLSGPLLRPAFAALLGKRSHGNGIFEDKLGSGRNFAKLLSNWQQPKNGAGSTI